MFGNELSETLEQQQQLANFHFPSLCCGCSFSFRNSGVCSSEERKALHQDFVCSYPAKATGSPALSLYPLPPCPAALPPGHHHLFPGTAPCTPCRADPECWQPNTKDARGGSVCLCGHSHVWRHNRITRCGDAKTIITSFPTEAVEGMLIIFYFSSLWFLQALCSVSSINWHQNWQINLLVVSSETAFLI